MNDILQQFVQSHELDEILAGTPIDLETVQEEKRESVVAILLHCCINGPFSPHKVTNYPIAGEVSLDEVLERRISNNGLKKTCEQVSLWLTNQGYDKGYMYEYGEGSFWPQNEYQR
jgi:hypothetical protein